MNMILHGIEAPNIVHTNTLAENISDIQDKDRFDVVLANPPFGGKERPEVQQNFPIKTGETAFLFLQHFIKSLKAGGRAAIVIKNTFLSNTDNASVALRKELLENCNLHTVLDMPGGTFQGAGVKTVVLFFEKGAPTRKIWFYKLDPGRNLGKTNPLNDDDLKDFVALQAKFKDSENSWTVDAKSIDKTTYDLSVKNPNKADETELRDPKDIIAEMAALDAESAEILQASGGCCEGGLERKATRRNCDAYWQRCWTSDKTRRDTLSRISKPICATGDFDIERRSGTCDSKTTRTSSDTSATNGDLSICEGRPSSRPRLPSGRSTADYCQIGDRYQSRFARAEPTQIRFAISTCIFLRHRQLARIDVSGAVHQAICYRKALKTFHVPLPPLPEQQRIVAILDEAFAGLATATANAEKNLKNARELFESYLNSVFAAERRRLGR